MRTFHKGYLSQQQINQWLIDLRGNPHVPESGFDVTAIFRARYGGEDDYYFAGVNTEYIDHRLGTHGEESCIAGMITGLGKGAEFVEGWCMAAPRELKEGDKSELAEIFGSCCGKCRQQLAGVSDPDMPVHSVSLNGAREGRKQTTTLRESLPGMFTFRDFAPELGRDVQNRITGSSTSNGDNVAHNIIRSASISETEKFEWLSSLESFDFTTKVSQSVLLTLDNDYVVAGTKVEEAAFCAMSAVQSALANAVAEFGDVKVENAAIYSYGREDKELEPEQFISLPLSSIQCIGEFASRDNITITYFNGYGQTLDIPLRETARHIPTTRDASLKTSQHPKPASGKPRPGNG